MARAPSGQILHEIACLATAKLLELGLPASRAKDVGRAIAGDVAELFGGQYLYIPRGLPGETDQRNRRIVQLYDGRNVAWLARKFALSRRRILQIVAAERACREGSAGPGRASSAAA